MKHYSYICKTSSACFFIISLLIYMLVVSNMPFDKYVCLKFKQIQTRTLSLKILIRLIFHLIANYLQYLFLISVIVQ